MLVLPIKRKWFDLIISGEKKEEYREIKPYYNKRLGNYFIKHNIDSNIKKVLRKMDTTAKEIVFRNGYNYNSPSVKCKCSLNIGTGKQEWGAEEGKEYYILTILEIIEIRNHDKPPVANNAMAAVALPATSPVEPINDMQKIISETINKQIGIGIDIGEGKSRSGKTIKNMVTLIYDNVLRKLIKPLYFTLSIFGLYSFINYLIHYEILLAFSCLFSSIVCFKLFEEGE